ncbi:MAG TPA: type II toxin-antitoxin system HipA family toxin YjjJ [Ramlibacter sp.]|uniref:type II toxin-antitoxin system HipA family toxin YjjJ n=1 Tax=Ramlibacter sp. TaxID=1917967 RepID=UPI002B813077|nr:type II toxin-antitoxin system HipA family toxin YjjJ [Ramlibacter sp.]HVZ42863.1 type II toxin-antitoxin system HipA family toxin YjjJ [Ramlibacter sp.]
MRPSNVGARHELRRVLGRAPAATGQLAAALGVSLPSLHRMLNELGGELVSSGSTRNRKHALRRLLRGTDSTIPVYSVDAEGRAASQEPIELIQPEGCLARLAPAVWPAARENDGWWEGLPYPLYDMRPQGYLGRIVARSVARQLHVSDNPDAWSDDDVLYWLVQHGSDQPGNLIVGEQAIQAWNRQLGRGLADIVAGSETPERYVEFAEASLNQGVAGSSAGGEFPKFTAARDLHDADTPHVIVKFSGSENSAAVRRWSDLLIAEHLALEAIRQCMAGHRVARSRILIHGGRTFLESERFDRHGEFGRSPVATLTVVDAALIGTSETAWPKIMRSPAARSLFPPAVIDRAEELWWFGRFIANSDMHKGNLTFRPRGDHFDLAPAYDMLPMHYAPLRAGEVPSHVFDTATLPLPPRGREADWHRVVDAARVFWRSASEDVRIGESFRAICAENGRLLQRWSEAWRPES